jgi:hypothetical protein
MMGEVKGRTAGRDSALAKKSARGAKGHTAAAADARGAASRKDQAAEVRQDKKLAAREEGQLSPGLGTGSALKPVPAEVGASAQGATPGAAPSLEKSEPTAGTMESNKLRRMAQVAGQADEAPPSDRSPGEAYASVLREHGLPVVWDESVPPETLLRAETDLRRVYQTHHAGADSARIRLYLAEAERARLDSSANSAAIEQIANHYRRAISLARGDAALAALARRRLGELLMTRPPASNQTPTTP